MTTFPTWVFDDSPIPDPLGFGERAVKFIRALKHPKTGKPFQLDRWQDRIVRRIYGPRNTDGSRIVRNVVMMIPRGARKTTLGAALALLHTIGPEKVPYGQVVLAAYDRAQARIAFDEAHGIVMADPRIVAATEIVSSQHRITHSKSRATLRAASSDGAAANGKTPSFCLFDEVHCWKKRDLFDVLRTGLGKTAGTLSVVISQAGRGSENLAFETFDYARKVARGDIVNPGTLPILFETPADADWQDEAVWHRVNPGLPIYPDLPSLRAEALEAQDRPALREKFKNDHLNVWLDHSETPFVPMEIYDHGCAPIDLDALKASPCWIGVDMSIINDLTAVVAAFRVEDPEDDEPRFVVASHFFCPEVDLRARSERDRVPYVEWAKGGFITATPGNVIDHGAVVRYIDEFANRFEVREIAFDPAYAQGVMGPLGELGRPVMTMKQGWITQSPALNTLERAFLGRRLQHGGQPVLRWCFQNVQIHTDSNGNRTMSKKKSTDRIDGAAATWMAVARAAANDAGTSIFNDPNVGPESLIWNW